MLDDQAMTTQNSAATIQALRIHDVLFVASISFLYFEPVSSRHYLSSNLVVDRYFDHLITFGDEIRFLWKKAKTPSTYSFLVNRYLAFFGDIVVTFFVFKTIPYSWSVILLNLNHNSSNSALSKTAICLFLTVRIYALYGRQTKVWVYMLGAGAILMGVSLWAISGNGGTPVDGVVGCHIANSQTSGIHLAVPWEALFIYDVLIAAALLYKSLQTRSESRSEPLLSLLIRDGAVYFVVMAAINLANILTFYLAGPLLRGCLSTMASSLSVTMMSRLMLNLHAVESKGIFSTAAHVKFSGSMTWGESRVELDTLWTRDLERSACISHQSIDISHET
ncbi:hypothetical protein B0H12DRAFT_1235734 [Mycena haematopus]|nr:hypothetical protein B0H12DRAFT_1235734 [Mycena haematopus]